VGPATCSARDHESDRRAGSLDSRWRQALETAPEVYVALDGEGRIADWNRSAAGLFGLQRQGVLGSPLTRFVPEQNREQVQADLLAALRRTRDGQHDPMHLDLLTETGASSRRSAWCGASIAVAASWRTASSVT
jgi:PAS domain-containing protein